MMEILSNYNLSSGDTTSEVYTFSSSSRRLIIEILTDSISGNSAYVIIETSIDSVNWVQIPGAQIQINRNSDSYVYNITESEGRYVRAILRRMDAHSGTISISAEEPAVNSLHGTYTPTFTPQVGTAGTITALHESLYTEVDTEAVSGSMIVSVALDAGEQEGFWNFNLPIVPNNDFTDQFDLQINVGYPINQAPNPLWVFKVTAEVGAKTGRFYFNSDTLGDSVIISFFYSYHNN